MVLTLLEFCTGGFYIITFCRNFIHNILPQKILFSGVPTLSFILLAILAHFIQCQTMQKTHYQGFRTKEYRSILYTVVVIVVLKPIFE